MRSDEIIRMIQSTSDAAFALPCSPIFMAAQRTLSAWQN